MLKRKTVFSKLFISYSIIIVISFLLFIGVFFYLFHINLYKEYEAIFQHHYEQVEKQLLGQENLDWRNNETIESLSYTLNQPGYHIYITDEKGKQIFGPEPKQVFEPIDIPKDIVT